VYVVDQNIPDILYIRDCLEGTEFQSVGFHHGIFLCIPLKIPSTAIISLEQDYLNGLALCKDLRNSNPNILLILTSTLDISHHECKILETADILLLKPFGRSELLACLRNLSSTRDLSE